MAQAAIQPASSLDLGFLHPKQSYAYQSPATEILFGGAAGGGKSLYLRKAAILWCLLIPELQIYFFRRLFPQLWKNHMTGPSGFPALLAEFVNRGVCRITGKSITFANGSQIHLNHCQYEKNVYDYQGPEIHVLIIDELGQWPKTMYTYLRSRVRMVGIKVPEELEGYFPRIVCSANPGGPGHNWIKANWWITERPIYKIYKTPEIEGGMDRQFIQSLLEDNPSMEKDDPKYRGRIMGLGSKVLVAQLLKGDWTRSEGGALDDLWLDDVHVIEPFAIPKSWYIDRSFDYGTAAPFSVGWWAESDGTEAIMRDGTKRTFPPKTLFRISEYYGWDGKTPNKGCAMVASQIARKIVETEAQFPYSVKPGPADTMIFDKGKDGQSIADDMGRQGISWTRADKSPGTRVPQLGLFRNRLLASTADPMEEPGFFVFDHCRQFRRTVPSIQRSERNPEDVDTDVEDHIYDEARYRIATKRRTVKAVDAPW